MSHPLLLPDFVVAHWIQRLGGLLDRPDDQEPLPISMLGFYEITEREVTETAGIVAIAANSREKRMFAAVPDAHGMGQFMPISGMARAFSIIRKRLPARQQIVAAVYARDVTIGGAFALVRTSFVPLDPTTAPLP